ncbi:lymphocyte specific protein 1 b isoform X2 [Chanos chanos]|uniref:Lymphocyte specific protein 1 b isoform X2 n=1 Tax=Chanos chanos TaxID=29144 RepID=A0A6J2UP23_CHACN|nr:non-muscle caldesmon-like isoform X2 [Chanos chanos]
MSNGILRRNSSKLGLQNLLRITAQRSLEDAEEIERERRRRARAGRLSSSGACQDSEPLPDDTLCQSDLKSGCTVSQEEDEGFGDWTQRLERRRQRRDGGESVQAEEDTPYHNGTANHSEPCLDGTASHRESCLNRRANQDVPPLNGRASHGTGNHDEPPLNSTANHTALKLNNRTSYTNHSRNGSTSYIQSGSCFFTLSPSGRTDQDEGDNWRDKEKEKRKELKISYTSKVVLQQDVKRVSGSEDAAGGAEEAKSSSSVSDGGEEEAGAECALMLESMRLRHQQKENEELEELRQKQAESEAELQELQRRREERRKVRQEEERKREEEEQQRQAREQEEKQRMKEEMERRRLDATERRLKRLSTSSAEAEEPFSPKSPSFKITERTESLNRSVKKSNSIKRTEPAMPVSKIDDRLEQYHQAIEVSSKETKPAKPVLLDMSSPPEPVAAKKSLFEAGDAWSQGTGKTASSKDTEGLKVGVADLISQWVKGNPEDMPKTSASKPEEVKAGEVRHKKNLWETRGDSASQGKPGISAKNSGSKKYKFIVTGHGKYEKVLVDGSEDPKYSNGKSAGLKYEDA